MPGRRIIDQAEAQTLSDQDYLIADNANLGTRKIAFSRLLTGATPLPMGYINGLFCNYTDVNKFTVDIGVARSTDNMRNMGLLSSLTKDINKSFELGTDGGCMPSTLTLEPTTKYYIFLISSSAGLTDIVIDKVENCANGLADSVVQFNNFDKYVMIGKLMVDANNHIYSESVWGYGDLRNRRRKFMNYPNKIALTSVLTTLPYDGGFTATSPSNNIKDTIFEINGVSFGYCFDTTSGISSSPCYIEVYKGDTIRIKGILGSSPLFPTVETY